jgi:hypothetical protein
MRFLADEGVDAAIVTAIRSDGHDVRWMAEEMEGSRTTSSSTLRRGMPEFSSPKTRISGSSFFGGDFTTAASCLFASMALPTTARAESSPKRLPSIRPNSPGLSR